MYLYLASVVCQLKKCDIPTFLKIQVLDVTILSILWFICQHVPMVSFCH